MEAQGGAVQMITGAGVFNATAVDDFIKASQQFTAPHASYTVVSIIGPQSSGKSYLLNSLFGTNFEVMNAAKRRGQTTKGIWIARCIRPCMIIMDVEGGTERGEDDTLFEKQSALFALAVSDVILVNMWVYDIGRQEDKNIPLLTLILQQRVKLDPCKTRVIFVIRDYNNKTPFDELKNIVMESIENIWKLVRPRKGNAKISDYFQVSVVGLPWKGEEKAFKEKCTELRKSLSTGNAGSRQDTVPASAFSFSAKGLWDDIRQNGNLNLPAYKEMVATTMCEEIMEEILGSLASNQDYSSLERSSSNSASDFSSSVQSLLNCTLAKYDEETDMYVANVRDKTRSNLETKILQILEPKCKDILQNLPMAIFNASKDEIGTALNKAKCPCDSVNIVVKPYLDKFDNSCAGLHLEYEPLVSCQRERLEAVLVSYAEEKASSIQFKRTGFKVARAAFAIGRLAFGDPTSLVDVAALFLL
ncbi:protein ROOT HAIR DEFECTIVE 3-like [Typha angustifolia]|uniref:protein ROOT HAIR DEFECTIVE 3-like n=1 Tax=Typha angustifolia TaxID=59011 RepID=UPI003C2E0E90